MASQDFDFPDHTEMVDGKRFVTVVWTQLFTRWHRIITSTAQSGTTANRPTQYLWIGRTYFDTDLGLPIWVQQVTPAVIWIDAAGNPV